jgi:7,8-dihydropterin-6-yl-methyl-4-(beta-D-ribofuranosyl)aminobenzene 5'-phosphate synthase
MSLKEKGYAVYWAAAGVTRPRATAAFLRERRRLEQEWEAEQGASAPDAGAAARHQGPRPAALSGLGTADTLSILPLVEFYPSDPRLAGEPGVSYLVTVDGKKILFDVGRNVREEHPSPLLRNMEALGLSPADIDAVFISHCHLDHVGGIGEMRHNTFSLSGQPVDLTGKTAYLPTAMTHPSATVEVITGPRKIAEGVASTGPITRAIWLMGPISEQALLVDVKGKGVVMIVGCGHPLVSRLVARARAVTGRPLYGVAGGLHFPVTASRVGRGGQNILGNGKLPWQRIRRSEARDAAALLAGLDIQLVALSGHDSCDWSLGAFKEALGDRCRTLRVGEEIVVA